MVEDATAEIITEHYKRYRPTDSRLCWVRRVVLRPVVADYRTETARR